MSTTEVRVPDIGDYTDVPVIEVLVKPGDRVKKNDSLITLESEKASMEVPSSDDGVVETVNVKVGDKVSKGTPIVILSPSTELGTSSAPTGAQSKDRNEPKPGGDPSTTAQGAVVNPERSRGAQDDNAGAVVELRVPDIGDFKDVPVIEVLIKPGDEIKKEAPLVTLESDKASMEVPATTAGVVQDVRVKVGDKVAKGAVIATVRSSEGVILSPSTELGTSSAPQGAQSKDRNEPVAAPQAQEPSGPSTTAQSAVVYPERSRGAQDDTANVVHASPAIRRFARELGVTLGNVTGSGPRGRITRDDVQNFVKRALRDGTPSGGGGASFAGLPAWPKVDFAQYGEIERKPLARIKKFSGPNLHRNWLQIPHITNYDEADVTELEAFRNEVNAEQTKAGGAKLTMLAFLIRVSVAALKRFPEFNSSLDGEELVYKHYYNIGFAADTPNGLVVPVLKGADTKGLLDIARETSELAAKARDGKLGMADMQGSTFTISSIGGIGGTQFTQIVNAPEVAILGATRAAMKPVWDGKGFEPRLMLPISVSYDHRVIDGAGAARFLVYFAALLRDFKRVLL